MFQAITRHHPKVTAMVPLCVAALYALGCAPDTTPAAPADQIAAAPLSPGARLSKAAEKGYIDGWFDGNEVQLFYTKSYFCAEPPVSGAPTNCELGAEPEIAPRPGPIPTIYALAPVGFQPDVATLSCLRGSPCLNHPAMIDASRIGGPPAAPALSHSHILNARGGGWFKTVNVRVFSAAAWNEIAAAKTLAKVRELQGGNPDVGVPGVISADTPTNIYFFIAGWR